MFIPADDNGQATGGGCQFTPIFVKVHRCHLVYFIRKKI